MLTLERLDKAVGLAGPEPSYAPGVLRPEAFEAAFVAIVTGFVAIVTGAAEDPDAAWLAVYRNRRAAGRAVPAPCGSCDACLVRRRLHQAVLGVRAPAGR
jgi:hypothetical protein